MWMPVELLPYLLHDVEAPEEIQPSLEEAINCIGLGQVTGASHFNHYQTGCALPSLKKEMIWVRRVLVQYEED